MRLENIAWPKAQEYFKENDIILLAIGSLECHGRHLPLGTDTLIPNKLLELIEEKSNILIAPTIPYGACESLEPFPGTVNLGAELLYQLLYSVTENLYNHGARKIVILNGHGGNRKVIERVGMKFEKKGALFAVLNWWLMTWDMKAEWKGGHGGAEETAGIMGVNPDLIDYTEMTEEPLQLKDLSENLKANGFFTVNYKGVDIEFVRSTSNVTDNGWIGPDHPTKATVEWGNEMLQTTADYIVDFIEEYKNVDLQVVLHNNVLGK